LSQQLTQKLTTQDRHILESCEEIIDEGLKTILEKFYVVGQALVMIRQQRLYRAKYSSFDEYVTVRWDMKRRTADRFIKARQVLDQITPTAVMPTRESQIRPLTKLDSTQWREAWERAVVSAEGGRVTARHVEEIVSGAPVLAQARNFGERINFRGLDRAPINEQGVVFLFGMVGRELGFEVASIQNPFPDCVAMRLVDKRRKRYHQVKVEFEFQSRNFLKHSHTACDVIVCWEHNWRDCPHEVIELRTEILELPPH
jgi:hypothetical protein